MTRDPAAGRVRSGPGSSLWWNRRFDHLWVTATVSLASSEVTGFALPTLALVVLHAGAVEVGFLRSLETLSFPILGILAGIWVDRLEPRRVMIASDACKALTLLALGAAFALGAAGMAHVFAAAAVGGACTLFFQTGNAAYLPALVGRDQLLDGNAKLMLGSALARMVAPSAAGFLIGAVGGGGTLAFAAAALGVSITALATLGPHDERRPRSGQPRAGLWGETKEGVAFVFRDPILRSLTLITGCYTLSTSMAEPLVFVLAYQEVGLEAQQVGLAFGIGSAGLLGGTLIAPALARRVGVAASLGIGTTLLVAALAALPLAYVAGPMLVLTVCGLCRGVSRSVYNINQLTLRQTLTSLELQGRMNATMRTIFWGVMPLGSVIGSVIASRLGLVAAFAAAAAIAGVGTVLVLTGPVRAPEASPSQA